MSAVDEARDEWRRRSLQAEWKENRPGAKEIVGEARDKEKKRGEDPCRRNRCCDGDHANKARVTVKGHPCTRGMGL